MNARRADEPRIYKIQQLPKLPFPSSPAWSGNGTERCYARHGSGLRSFLRVGRDTLGTACEAATLTLAKLVEVLVDECRRK